MHITYFFISFPPNNNIAKKVERWYSIFMKNGINRLYIPLRLSLLGNTWTALSCADERDGLSIRTKYRYHGQKNLARQCYSVSKSIVALACGFLFDRGLLRPEDRVADTLKKFFPENADIGWYEVTLEDLFFHRTGARDAIDLDNEQAPRGEVLTALFSSPITGERGKTWRYSDGNYYILARVFEEIAGETAESYLSKNLFRPLGFYYDTWAKDDAGHILGGTGLYLRTEDMAKIGVLIMNRGVYDGVRYLSEEWIDLCTSIKHENRYGFGIRTIDKDSLSMTGMNGQGVFIDRKKKLVYAWHAQHGCSALGLCLLLKKTNII